VKALAVDANQGYQSAGLLPRGERDLLVLSRMSLRRWRFGRFSRPVRRGPPWLSPGGSAIRSRRMSRRSRTTNASGIRRWHRPSSPPPVTSRRRCTCRRRALSSAWPPTTRRRAPRTAAADVFICPSVPGGVWRGARPAADADVSSGPGQPPRPPRACGLTSSRRSSGAGFVFRNRAQHCYRRFAAPPVPRRRLPFLPLGVQQIARTRQGYRECARRSQARSSPQRYEPPYDGRAHVLAVEQTGCSNIGSIVLVGHHRPCLAIAIAYSSDDLPTATPPATQPAARTAASAALDRFGRPLDPATAQPRALTADRAPEAFGAENRVAPDRPGDAPPRSTLSASTCCRRPQGAAVLLAGKSLARPRYRQYPHAHRHRAAAGSHTRFGDLQHEVRPPRGHHREVTLVTAPSRLRALRAGTGGWDGVRSDRRVLRTTASRSAVRRSGWDCQPPDRITPSTPAGGGKACPVASTDPLSLTAHRQRAGARAVRQA